MRELLDPLSATRDRSPAQSVASQNHGGLLDPLSATRDRSPAQSVASQHHGGAGDSGDSPALLLCTGTGTKRNPVGYMSAKGRFPEGEARFFLKQICEGVAYCHSLDIAHRDLKCANIFLSKSMDVKIGGMHMHT